LQGAFLCLFLGGYMRNLKISVVDNIVRVIPDKVLTSGEANTVECDFILGKEFDGLIVKASFNGIIRPVIDRKCTLPKSDNSGIYEIGVVGYSLDKNNKLVKRESPVPAAYEVETGSYSLENDNENTPEPSAFEIMLAKMQSIYDQGNQGYILTEADKQEIAEKIPQSYTSEKEILKCMMQSGIISPIAMKQNTLFTHKNKILVF